MSPSTRLALWAAALRPHDCIVAFHRIAAYGTELDYPPAGFERLCRFWRRRFEVVSLSALHAGPGGGRPRLAITFDDGYADNAETAGALLARLHLPATFFVTTAALGTGRRFAWDNGLAERPRWMSWDQVRELRARGFEIGSHTATHPRLAGLGAEALRGELEGSRDRLAAELGSERADFAYPFGGAADCDEGARQAVRAAGYRSCLSCHGGLVARGDSPFRWHRMAISPRWHATPAAWMRRYLHALLRLAPAAAAHR